ncbi:MAG: hypothetical protein EZS28_011614 [Streblomastix strix]|uniref:Uncharacterized protein n=1 Tax=Streblomastix strix TaxID=222440 RepID=A0A5J4WDA7_9EUKA|nr:MAG: hypothetical protein EZS28_011614 [Streblomastix strix]
MPKSKNKPSYNFEQCMRRLKKVTPEFDFDSINAKMRKDQPKTKRQFVRKLFLLEERKVISGLTNTEIAGIVSCNELLVSKARNNRLAIKSSRKKKHDSRFKRRGESMRRNQTIIRRQQDRFTTNIKRDSGTNSRLQRWAQFSPELP